MIIIKKTIQIVLIILLISSFSFCVYAQSSRMQKETLKEIAISKNLIYQDLMKEALKAFDQKDFSKALDLFYRAHLVCPDEKRPVEYINLIKAQFDQRLKVIEQQTKEAQEALNSFENAVIPLVDNTIEYQEQKQEIVQQPVVEKEQYTQQQTEEKKEFFEESSQEMITNEVVQEKQEEQKEQEQIQPVEKEVQRVLRLPKKQALIETIDLKTLVEGKERPILTLPMWETVRVRAENIKRLMVIDPDVASVSRDSMKEFLVKGLRRGTTFLHIWDDTGRTTLYIEVLLPIQEDQIVAGQPIKEEFARPFRFGYTNDWSAYYKGEEKDDLKRQEKPSFQQTFSMDGETPWGILDASHSRYGYGASDDVGSYTLGLSNIPVPTTKHFNIRIFDATRPLSPLTFPGTRLRGIFADVNFFDDVLGISIGSGKQQSAYAFYTPGFSSSSSRKSKVDMLRVVLFPKDLENQVAFNLVRGYGRDYEEYLTERAYSIEARKKIARVLLNMELARNDDQLASAGGLTWQGEQWMTSLNMRDINKDYTAVLTNPSAQGEVGATWSTNFNSDRLNIGSVIDIYRDRLYFNPEDPDAFNYDTEIHSYMVLDENRRWIMDSLIRYIDTPGEESPREFLSFQQRLSKNFKFINLRDATIFIGGGYQQARYERMPNSEYDRYSALCGVQVPLLEGLSGYANYEYSWLHEPETNMDTNPSVFNTGLNYSKNLTKKLSGSCSISYRNEQDVKGFNSFLAGEDSVSLGAGLSYMPVDDVNLFLDGRMRKVMSEIDNESDYYDLDLRFGMRMSWGSKFSWNPTGHIAGFVFKDRNGDGKFDLMQEEGIPHVTIKIGDDEIQTDEKGWYKKTVYAKRVIVLPTLESLPKGFVFSTEPSFKVDIVQGMTRRVDFGLTPQSGIYGVVYIDRNENGVLDQEDQFIPRIQILLDGEVAALSDARGAYFFNNVSPGKHTLSLNMKHVPMEFLPNIKMKNEIEISEGSTYIFHIPMKLNKVQDFENNE